MRLPLDRVACVLLLGAALMLLGCQKKQAANQKGSTPNQKGSTPNQKGSTSNQQEVAGPPQGNPILPRPGQQLHSGGVIQDVRQAARRTVDLAQLKGFALAYFQYQTLNGKGPSSVEDIKGSLDRNMIEALKEGTCVAVWNLRNPSSSTIVVYVKDPDQYGTRVVAMYDGSALRMTQQDFDAAIRAK